MPTTISNTITTDHADLISYHAKRTGQIPSLYVDRLTNRIVADISLESRDAFQADIDLQRYLSAKTAVWRAISEMRKRGLI
jgi:hypothetical protein